MLARIVEVHIEAGSSIRLRFEDGLTGTIDLARLIHPGGVFAALADADVFGQARIGDRGRSLEWPGEIDLCADALHREIESGESQRATA